MDSLPANFTLGDEKMYGGFYNRPLTSPQEYLCFVLAQLQSEPVDGNASNVRDIPTHTQVVLLIRSL